MERKPDAPQPRSAAPDPNRPSDTPEPGPGTVPNPDCEPPDPARGHRPEDAVGRPGAAVERGTADEPASPASHARDQPVSTPNVVGSGEPAPEPMHNRPARDMAGDGAPPRDAETGSNGGTAERHARDRAAIESPVAPRIPRLLSTTRDGRPPDPAGPMTVRVVVAVLAVAAVLLLLALL